MGLNLKEGITDLELLTIKVVLIYGWLWRVEPTESCIKNNFKGIQKLQWPELNSSRLSLQIKENGELACSENILPGYNYHLSLNATCQELIIELRKCDVPGFNYFETN